MPGKNFSAVQRLAQSIYTSPRYFSGRCVVAKNYDSIALHHKLNNRRVWPQREETYAAIQLMRQNRSWDNVRKFGSAINHSMSMARRGATPRRNNILTAKNASAKRVAMLRGDAVKKRGPVAMTKHVHNRAEVANSLPKEASMKKPQSEKRKKKEEKDDGDFMDVRSVRETLFGIPETNEDDQEKQREDDAELLRRVSKQSFTPGSKLSRKVIAPYQTYKSHRNCWAEFRHRLVFGGSSYY
ncbi:uncharacterized protein LOC133842351 [Drosophila sulfurigaster albostrigata]|uniref:uncharacterized protein LOC133842351 n=1 Tax=Drosophila sulfurigaster albostrigata TaxID=89887 RepID=UPI002D21CCEB|nr:uncharacterized protein LOC133842351 [Drosophila sulfurigaster albostrigata]